MARHPLRKVVFPALALGCFLSGTATAWAGQVSTADQSAVGRCAAPPPAPNLPPGRPDPALLWPQQRLGLSGDWYLSRGKGVTVAVIDTGVDPSNPAFAPHAVLSGPSVVAPGDSADYDCDGHGTAVAAIIAGAGAGLFGFIGVAPDAHVLPIRQTYDPAAPGSSATLATAIRTATAAGARIVNISMGVRDDSTALRSAVRNAIANDVLIVAAVGSGRPTYPAALPGVLAVGAIDRDGEPPSGQGSGVMVSAPGGPIAVPAIGSAPGLTSMAGPGLAAPYVSGAAALVLSYRPHLHNWQVVRRLEATADQPASDVPVAARLSRPSAETGYGVIDPYTAMSKDLPAIARPDPSIGPDVAISPPDAAVPGQDRTAARIALGASAAGVLAFAAPVALAAARRGRVKGPRAGV